MPAVSPKQYGFMAGVASGSISPPSGLSPDTAKEFVTKTPPDKRSKFAKALAKKRKGNGGAAN